MERNGCTRVHTGLSRSYACQGSESDTRRTALLP